LKDYAHLGVRHWNSKVDDAMKKRARTLLTPAMLAEHPTEADNSIETLRGRGRQRRFIPMPHINHGGIEQCFFLPVNEPLAKRPAFDLLLLCQTEPHCLGFRFEPVQQGTHEYGHIQMNRKMMDAVEVAGIPTWIPDSYPAFPLRTSDPFQLFLSMATS